MKVLLIEGDHAARERLTDYLLRRGHRVRAAACIDAGLRELRAGAFDAVVTAWQLGDDDASAIVASAHGPCVVLGAETDDVARHPAIAARLATPVEPSRGAAVLADLEGRDGAGPCGFHGCVDALPCDTRDRVRLALSILDDPVGARVDDDGQTVTIEGRLAAPERWVALLDGLGGDLRVLTEDDVADEDGPLRLVLRLDRRGRPRGVEVAVAAGEPWPTDGPFALDLDDTDLAPDRFLTLCDQVRSAQRRGRSIDLINVPSHLRMCLEAVGRADVLPMRRASGPRQPEVLGQPWR